MCQVNRRVGALVLGFPNGYVPVLSLCLLDWHALYSSLGLLTSKGGDTVVVRVPQEGWLSVPDRSLLGAGQATEKTMPHVLSMGWKPTTKTGQASLFDPGRGPAKGG